MTVAIVDFHSYSESVTAALDSISARKKLSKQSAVLIKPNLVNASPHPVTTHVDCCEAVLEYVRSCSKADVVIAEGCGDASRDTDEIFNLLGYRAMAVRHTVPLVDLNSSPLQRFENKSCSVYSEIYLPEIAFSYFIISLPVLKVHSIAGITGTLKNMIGFAPPKYYSSGLGGWKKAAFHNHMQQAIIDLNQYRVPDLSLMDASVGLAEFHLGGRHCSPPVGKMLAGSNPWEVDREAAALLGLDWKKIRHLTD
ncbi:DUF362 domain-containing protein [Thermodesulfobacteriota bacterium]